MIYFLIGIGGMIGSLLRYGLSIWMATMFPSSLFTGTMIANSVGCFLLGWLTSRTMKTNHFPPLLTKAVGTGVIGSFTTFSTFSMETVELWMNREFLLACFYCFISVGTGFFFVFFGWTLGVKEKVTL